MGAKFVYQHSTMMLFRTSAPVLMLLVCAVGSFTGRGAVALDNGFTVPALGWSSWYAAPHGSQVTDAFVRASAQALVSSGLAKKGYKYINASDHSRLCVAPIVSVCPACYISALVVCIHAGRRGLAEGPCAERNDL